MLDHVRQHDDVESVGRSPSALAEALERLLADVQAELLARVAGRLARELEPDGLIAAPAGLVEQQAVAAADVEQAAARTWAAIRSSRRSAVARRPASSHRYASSRMSR